MARERPRWWLAITLFFLTFLSTTILGAEWTYMSRTDRVIDARSFITPMSVVRILQDRELLQTGLIFSCCALAILLAHELGHYIACRTYRLRSTLPYFLPVPLGFGTFGAFIRIKEPMRSRRELFDVGIAGPIAGFVVLVPIFLYGIAHSTIGFAPVPAADEIAVYLPRLGNNLLFLAASHWFHGELPPNSILNLHPAAIAAWLGCLATSLNLLPIGQLDGGHILYAVALRHQRRISQALWLGLALLGFLHPSWFFWCFLVLFLTRLRHPRLADEETPLGRGRQWLALVAVALLVLTLAPIPIYDMVTTLPPDLLPIGPPGNDDGQGLIAMLGLSFAP